MSNSDGYGPYDPYNLDAYQSATWTLEYALPLIAYVEAVAPKHHCHVALTGGVLYKAGARKDLDLMFYRIRQEKEIDVEGLLASLKYLGFEIGNTYGWLTKAKFGGKTVDLFFPERPDDPADGRSR